MRADRLLQIMLLLQTRRSMSAKDLAARLEVSERTIHRDMEALSTAGVPVYAERGAQGGWLLAEGYRTDWTGLRKEELLSLLASKPHRQLSELGLADAYEAALLKLLAGLTPAMRRDADYMRQRLYVDTAGWHPSSEEVPWLPILHEAVWEGRQLRIAYAGGGGAAGGSSSTNSAAANGQADSAVTADARGTARMEPEPPATERTVHPLGLVLKGSLWYFVAAQIDGSKPKTYRISRIRHAELLEEPAERPQNFDLAEYWQHSVQQFRSELPTYPARALVHRSVSARLEQTRFVRVSDWAGVTSQDGWREAHLQFNTLESACDIVLGFGTRVRVLEPSELRDAVRNAAIGIAELY